MLPVTIAVLCSGYVTYRYNVALEQTHELVHHSLEVSDLISNLMLDLQDLETGQRGYLITGEDSYLAPFEAAHSRFSNDLERLRDLVSDNQQLIEETEHITGLIHEKLDELDSTVEVRREQGFEAAREIVANNVGKETMDAIRDVVANMHSQVDSRLSENTAQLRRLENEVILIVGITIALSLFGRLTALLLPIWWRSRPNRRV
ncbi:MAG: CHASE3 domain-containing protein [Pseudomonadota bacterium]